MPLSFLTGERSLRRQRDSAQRGIREMYNPSQLNPQLNYARQRASEGIGRSGELARSQGLTRLFASDPDMGIFGGSQARAIAGTQAQVGQRSQAYSDMESRLAMADEQARQRGEAMTAQVQTQQNQMLSQRDAQLEQADMMYEAERSARRQALGGAALGIVGSIASTPFGGGASLVSRGLTSLFGQQEEEGGGLGREGLLSRNEAAETLEGLRAMDAPVDELEFDPVDLFGMDFAADPMDVPEPPPEPLQPTDATVPEYTSLLAQFSPDTMLPEYGDEYEGLTDEEALLRFEYDESVATNPITQRLLGNLIGYDHEAQRYRHSIADIIRSPFQVLGMGASGLYRSIMEREEDRRRRREEFDQFLQQRQGN